MNRLPLETQTLYAELIDRLTAYEADRAIGHVPGTFVSKTVKGQEYYYFQHSEPGGTKKQTYIGRRDDVLDAVVRRFTEEREHTEHDRDAITRLVTLLRAGGGITTDAPTARVLKALADAGVFRLGAVLVGTHAFVALGNLLGVRWSGGALRTQDVDLAAEPHLSVAVPLLTTDVPDVLEGLEMGFLPVPGLDPRSPSTSFKVRGQGLRVDLLAPSKTESGKPIRIPRFSAAAQPLRFLDYVMESPVRAAVIDGGGVVVNVPDPARFAFHKLIVASSRPAAMQTKREKDLFQAGQVLEVLLEDRPGDVTAAWDALAMRGPEWKVRVTESLLGLQRLYPEVVDSMPVY